MPTKQCLIVDDSEAVRRIVKHMLAAMGLSSAEAANGHEALNVCGTAMPDAILLDWVMPTLSGLDCLQAIRRMPGGDQPAVIYCTSENSPAEFARALAAGANEVIVKPFNREALRQRLASVGVLDR